VVKLSTIEVALGAIALVAMTSGSFLLTGGPAAKLMSFMVFSASGIMIAAAVLVSRINQYELSVREKLVQLLPRERVCLPGHGPGSEQTENDLFAQLGQHLNDQQALLTTQCLTLISGSDAGRELAAEDEPEIELRRLRAELAALDDQFLTEQRSSVMQGYESGLSFSQLVSRGADGYTSDDFDASGHSGN